jgi:2-polyprenyl-3-methyl-5-hydroxy-6-metoxy-1,4-benzoquinol methylase
MSRLRDIARNRSAHDRVARAYDERHGEIFNDIEQARLAAAAREAVAAVTGAPRDGVRALDVGAGTGNLTRQLLACGARVTAADLSLECLAVVRERFGPTGRLETAALDGERLAAFADGAFDLVACCSVLHHVPDYLALVRELGRVVRNGGVVWLDHERHDASWLPDERRDAFLREAVPWPAKTWRRFVRPAAYWRRVRPLFEWRRWLDRRWMPEGDLHIWPDDHIEWAQVESALAGRGVRALVVRDYLLYEPRYRREAWERWKDRVTDYRMWIGRKA